LKIGLPLRRLLVKRVKDVAAELMSGSAR
jgi:hypothetical protein